MAARQFGGFAGRGFTSLFPLVVRSKRWSQITDSTRKNMNFQALIEVQRYKKWSFSWPIWYASNLPEMRWDSMRVWATIDHSNDCSLNRKSFCMDYAVSWAKLEVMVITLEPQTSNIAESSCKYTNGFFICCYNYKRYNFITTGRVSSRSDQKILL